jgi:hypothetical protein
MAGGANQLNTSGTGAALNEPLILNLPAPIAGMLQREAKARKKSMAAIVTEWLEEMAEDRDAIRAANAAEKRSAGKPSISAEELYKQCGL